MELVNLEQVLKKTMGFKDGRVLLFDVKECVFFLPIRLAKKIPILVKQTYDELNFVGG